MFYGELEEIKKELIDNKDRNIYYGELEQKNEKLMGDEDRFVDLIFILLYVGLFVVYYLFYL